MQFGLTAEEQSGLVPIAGLDSRLAQDLFHEGPINVATSMRVRYAKLELALFHELMPTA